MKLQAIFFVASALSTVVSALNGKVDTLHNPNYNPHGPSIYLKALLKYGGEPFGRHPGALSLEQLIPHVQRQRYTRRYRAFLASNSTRDGFDPNLAEVDEIYVTPTTIGEGDTAQTLNLLYDTGSSDLWVFSILLPASETGDHNHTLYKAGETPTSKLVPGSEWAIMYLDGSGASGLVYTDTVDFGGLKIKKAVVEAANQTTSEFLQLRVDGLVGLALQPDTVVPTSLTTTTQQIATDRSVFEQPVFTTLLTRENEGPGFFTFGYINDSVVPDGNITYTDVLQSQDLPDVGAWTFSSSFAILNGKRFDRKGATAVCDTGTSVILTDTDILEAIYADIPGANFNQVEQAWVYPANTTKFPNVVFPVGDTQITLQDPSDFNVGPADDQPNVLIGSIQDNGGIGFDIFGVPWINNVYVVFDLGLTGANNTRLGVVQRKPSPLRS